MADENIDIEVTGFQTLKAQIKEAQVEYQKLLADVNATPAAVNAAAQRAADLKDKFDDANDSVNALTGAGKFQAVSKSITALSGGFTALQGAISLAGGDAKDFEKTFQKVQGAMALTQGLTALEDLGNSFGNLKKVAVNAFQGIKAAIGATGIGLLVIALGTIYAYWDDIKAVVSGVDAEQKKLNEDSAANLAIQEKQLNAISAQENILKLQGKSEEEIYQIKLDQYDATIKTAKVNLQNLEITEKKQIEAAQRNKDILQGIIRYLTLPLTLLLKTVDLVGEALGQDFGLEEKFSGGLAKLVFDPEEVKKEGDKAIEEAKTALTKLENERAGMILQHDAKRDAEQKAREEKADAARQKEEDAQKTHLEKIRDLQDKYGELMISDEDARALKTLENKQKKERDELQLLIDSYTKKKSLTAAEEKTLSVLRKEYDALILLQAKETADKKEEIEKKAEKQRIELYLATLGAQQAAFLQEEMAIDEKYKKIEALEKENFEKIKGSAEEMLKWRENYTKTNYTAEGKAFTDLEQLQLYYQNRADKITANKNAEVDALRKKQLEAQYKEQEEALKAQEDLKVKKAYEAANKILVAEESTDKQKRDAQEKLAKDLIKIEIDGANERIRIAKELGLDTLELEKDLAEKLNGVYQEDGKNWAESWLEKNKVALEQANGILQASTAVVNALAEYQKMKNQEELENTKAKYDAQQADLTAAYEQEIAVAEAAGQSTTDIKQKYADATAEIEYQRALENYKREKEGFENGKKVQYAQAVIGGIQGAIGAFSALAPIPVVGPVLGAIAAAAVAVTTAFQLATIAKTTYSGTPPTKPGAGGGAGAGGSAPSGSKRAQGGLLTGRRHSEGGIPTAFGELEGGEYVVNRSATESFLPLLEKINGMGKGSGAPNNLSVTGEQNVAQSMPIIKTYVVASDMTSQQEANKRLEDIARL